MVSRMGNGRGGVEGDKRRNGDRAFCLPTSVSYADCVLCPIRDLPTHPPQCSTTWAPLACLCARGALRMGRLGCPSMAHDGRPQKHASKSVWQKSALRMTPQQVASGMLSTFRRRQARMGRAYLLLRAQNKMMSPAAWHSACTVSVHTVLLRYSRALEAWPLTGHSILYVNFNLAS